MLVFSLRNVEQCAYGMEYSRRDISELEEGIVIFLLHNVTNMESRLPAMLVLWLGREFYRGKYRITDSSQVWTPDFGDKLGDHFGDKSMIPENATLFSISLLGKKIPLNVRENSMRRHGMSGRVYKGWSWIR
ncbi:hypothetical protein AVEN_247110-1 [Araneus ventricosus]|uniref:Uncharacterized protein n=1 Tax=Araneus ventricosus TaxID=182803 RepID=A0A4Y2R0E0_ARAVE|nr:hypothetical protein AVEN_247110-1 [Araneus ventricosus]